MSIIDELITDRTQADVDRQLELNAKWKPRSNVFAGTAAERAEWLAGTKGTYSADDLNRVGEAIAYIAGLLQEAGYDVSVAPRTDWSNESWVTPAAARQLLADLAALRAAFPQKSGTAQVPQSMERMTVTEANDIEKVLKAVSTLLSNIMADWFYSGEVYSGED